MGADDPSQLGPEAAELIKMAIGVCLNAARAVTGEDEPAAIVAALRRYEAAIDRFETIGFLQVRPIDYQEGVRRGRLARARLVAFRALVEAGFGEP